MSGSSGVPILVLVPTAGERDLLLSSGPLPEGTRVELCGFGPVAAAARTMQLLAELKPREAALAGIAGTLDASRAPPGSAWEAGAVHLDGVGVGEGACREGPEALGYPVLEIEGRPLGSRIDLPHGDGPLFLSVCAAAQDSAMAAERRRRFPDAVLEEMEGYGAALAARLAGVPFRLLRGISNLAGDRRLDRWRTEEALRAVAALLRGLAR